MRKGLVDPSGERGRKAGPQHLSMGGTQKSSQTCSAFSVKKNVAISTIHTHQITNQFIMKIKTSPWLHRVVEVLEVMEVPENSHTGMRASPSNSMKDQ